MNRADELLQEAIDVMHQRAEQRDSSETLEKSMKSTVEAFNAIFGKDLTETQGWMFMMMLKMVRTTRGKFDRDSWVDLAAYSALAAECEIEAQTKE